MKVVQLQMTSELDRNLNNQRFGLEFDGMAHSSEKSPIQNLKKHRIKFSSRGIFGQDDDEDEIDKPILNYVNNNIPHNPPCNRGHMEPQQPKDVKNAKLKLSVVEQVFQTEKLLSKILANNETKDVLTCRLVSSRWNTFATQILQQRKVFKLVFTFNSKTQAFTATTNANLIIIDESRRNLQLNNLTSLLTGSVTSTIAPNESQRDRQFPCTYFSFFGGNLNDPHLQSFLSAHGTLIKQLRLDLFALKDGDTSDTLSLSFLTKLLLDQAPNLEYLRLQHFPEHWIGTMRDLFPKNKHSKQNKNISQQILLPNLKVLELLDNHDISTKLFHSFLHAAVNLEDIFLWKLNLTNLNILVETNRTDLIKRLVFKPSCDGDSILLYEKIATANFQLKKLDFSLWFIEYSDNELRLKFTKYLVKIMKSSCETLEKLVWQPMRFQQGIELPVFWNLRKLKIKEIPFWTWLSRESPKYRTVLPRGVSLSEIFPRLECLTICCSEGIKEDDDIESFFEGFNYLPSINEFRIFNTNCCTTESIIKFFEFFPNIRSASFGCVGNFEEISQIIWKYLKGLEQLEIAIDVCSLQNQYPVIDSCFTGFSNQACMDLNYTVTEIGDDEIQKMRQDLSILDLKDLHRLHLYFYDNQRFTIKPEYSPILSDSIGRFAFQFCPQLRVSVSFYAKEESNFSKLKEVVDPIRSYVRTLN